MIAVVQLDVFSTIITPLETIGGKNGLSNVSFFIISFGFLALELREKIPLPRTQVVEMPVLKSETYPKNFVTFIKGRLSKDYT